MNLDYLRRYAATLAGFGCVAAAFILTRYPSLPFGESEQLGARFRFTKNALPEIPGAPAHKIVRNVHPSLERISAWISSLGAAATLADLDGDGLPNDLILVDPRTDLVTVAPIPGTGTRYQPFALLPTPLVFDSTTMAPMGTLAGDFNEDGVTDILVYFWGRTPILYLGTRNRHAPDQALSRSAYIAAELVQTNGVTTSMRSSLNVWLV